MGMSLYVHMVIRISSSIENFKAKLVKRTGCKEWTFKQRYEDCVFFGMYHTGDYVRLLLHRGRKKIFWCGGDIIKLDKGVFWKHFIGYMNATHYVENEVERDVLFQTALVLAEVRPMIFTELPEISFKPSEKPHVFVNIHEGREEEYGLAMIMLTALNMSDVTFHIYGLGLIDFEIKIDNLVFHQDVSEEEFNKQIHEYQASIRTNSFDGFSEITAKSILMGQYPITYIKYPYITRATTYGQLKTALKELSKKDKPNTDVANYWRKTLEDNLNEVLHVW